jgi:cell filamentation protein
MYKEDIMAPISSKQSSELHINKSVLADIRMEGFQFTKAEETLFQEIGLGKTTTTEARQNLLSKIQQQREKEPQAFIGATPSAEMKSAGTPYIYPETNILINNLGINNQSLLQEAERNLTGFQMIDLWRNPLQGKFDFKHLLAIHQAIFQDIFPWAGQVRTVNIGKAGSWFCWTEHIDSYQKEIFGRLKKENYLVGLEATKFARGAAKFLGDLNALHPFREGNGRTQREFLRYLALNGGYRINLSDITQEYMIFASRESFNGNYQEFERIVKNRLELIH